MNLESVPTSNGSMPIRPMPCQPPSAWRPYLPGCREVYAYDMAVVFAR